MKWMTCETEFKYLISFIIGFILFIVLCIYNQKKASVVSQKDSLFTLSFADQRLTVDLHGGRITSFQMNEKEIIGPGGSTFWVSPQSLWAWPPVKEHHEDRYTWQISGDTLVLKSKKDSLLNIEIIKMIYSNSTDSSFTIRYGILNSGDVVRDVAPWENTRTFKSALIFYPKGMMDSTASNPVFGTLELRTVEGINWFTFEPIRVKGKSMGKVFADGADGWIAEANDGLMLIKKFEDIPLGSQAPGEGEIEIFSDLENRFLEMEEQGPLTSLKPQETLWWEVKWILRKIPDSISVKEGNGELINLVKDILR
jgi:hypothetical protein